MSNDGDPCEIISGRFAAHLDSVDRAIIARLQRDGRISVKALAEQVHISRANAYTRMARMLSDGVIAGFSVHLDPPKTGLGTSAYVSVTIDQTAWRAISAKLREIPYVEHFALVGGDYDVLLLVRAPDNSALRQVVLERLHDIPGVQASRTWLVFEESTGRGVPWDLLGA